VGERIVNYRNITLQSMKSGDTIYIQKNESGCAYNYFCKFIEFKKGIVKAEIISYDKIYCKKGIHEIITARPNKCFLWGNDGTLTWNHCLWFDKKGGLEK